MHPRMIGTNELDGETTPSDAVVVVMVTRYHHPRCLMFIILYDEWHDSCSNKQSIKNEQARTKLINRKKRAKQKRGSVSSCL